MGKETIRAAIGANIRHWRKRRGISEDAFAARLGISHRVVQKYESGADSPTCDELMRIAAILNCGVDELCGEKL